MTDTKAPNQVQERITLKNPVYERITPRLRKQLEEGRRHKKICQALEIYSRNRITGVIAIVRAIL